MRRLAWVLVFAFAVACSKGGGPELEGSGGQGGAATAEGGASTSAGTDVDPCVGVDLQNDPDNCGSCGRTCVIPGGEAACVAGECAMGLCEDGLADCDGDLNNGCEAAVDCNETDTCMTVCDSVGNVGCANVCAPTCEIPTESCNAVDDDCDGSCDNGAIAGCRIGVHRASGANGHFYGIDQAEAQGQGTIEALDYFYLYTATVPGAQPLFRCVKGSGKTWLTTDTQCEAAGSMDAQLGFVSPTPLCGSTPLYRLLNAPAGAHFFTISASERDNAITTLGFTDEGTAGHVWAEP